MIILYYLSSQLQALILQDSPFAQDMRLSNFILIINDSWHIAASPLPLTRHTQSIFTTDDQSNHTVAERVDGHQQPTPTPLHRHLIIIRLLPHPSLQLRSKHHTVHEQR